MLADPRAHEALDEFVSQWLRFDRLLTASKDRRKFPYFTRETANAMTTEARTFVSDLVWNDGNFMTLFTRRLWLRQSRAGAHLWRDSARERVRPRSVSGRFERAGILGQGLFLALTAKPEDSSPTARGLFVREQFLCQHVPDPPPGVNTNLPPVTEAKPQTNRDRMSEHTTNSSCAACHKLMDGVGFGFEKFDAIGAKREQLVLEFRTNTLKKTKKKASTSPREPSPPPGYRRIRGRHPRFGIYFTPPIRSGPGEESAMPGVYREAVFPLPGRKNGYAGGPSPDPDGLR